MEPAVPAGSGSRALMRAGFAVPPLWALLHAAAPRSEAWAEAILLLGPWVLMPLGLQATGARHRPLLLAAAATAFTGAFLRGPGAVAAVLTLPWLGWTLARAWHTLRAAPRGVAGWCAASAWLFLPVGAAWSLADRAGWRPLGFDPVLVRLTAIHFHHAGFSAPLLAGLAALRLPGRAAKWTGGLMLAGVPLTALGITATRLDWSPWWETAGATVMVAAGFGTVALYCRLGRRETGVVRGCFLLAAASLAAGALLALSYAWRFAAVPLLPDIPSMRAVHGTANAIGFGVVGLLGWARVRARMRRGRNKMVPEEGIEPTRV